jgi:hypothetical protein
MLHGRLLACIAAAASGRPATVQTFPSPSVGAPLLSASPSPPPCWGMSLPPPDGVGGGGADFVTGGGGGGGAGCETGAPVAGVGEGCAGRLFTTAARGEVVELP